MKSKELLNRYQIIWDTYIESELNVSTISHSTKLLNRNFVFQYDHNETECDILFVGINPSYNGHDPKENRHYSREQALQHAYFQPFKKITEELQEVNHSLLQWTHIDCLVFRETNQKYIEQILLKTDNSLDFIMLQLTIARERIEHIKPKVIVVSNALARRLMGNDRFPHNANYNVWMGLEFEFCPILGTQKIINHETLKGTPVFFTSMLSGQRALDNGSRQRLVWHISQALRNHHQLPVFFNYKQEETDNGYETIQDFFISWALRCANPKYREANPRIVEYSQRILHALIETTNQNQNINIPPYQGKLKYEIKEVKTWRQWKFIDLVAEILVTHENNEEELIVLNIENKWYSILREHQLTESIKRVEEHYANHDKKPRIINIALFADEEKKHQYFDLCIRKSFCFQSVGLLLSHNESHDFTKTGNDLFDAYWLDGVANFN